MTEEPTKLTGLAQWPIVGLAFVGGATVFGLVFWGKQDLFAISSFITSIASIFIGVYLRQVSRDTNGNLSKRDAKIEDMQRQLNALHNVRTIETAQLARQAPASTPLPPTLTSDSYASGVEALSGPTVSVPTVQRT